MARTIRYVRSSVARTGGPTLQSKRGPDPAGAGDTDGYLERLTKYVPAEVLAFFVPAAALAAGSNPLRWVVLLVGFFGTPFYLWVTSLQLAQDKKPKRYMFVLAPIAFLIWAVNVHPAAAALVGMDKTVATLLLFVGVFLIPGVDIALDYRSSGA